MNERWAAIQAAIKERIGAEAFEIWFKPARLGRLDPTVAELTWPNRYYRDWVGENYEDAVFEAVREVVGAAVEVRLRVEGDAPEVAPPSPAPAPEVVPRVAAPPDLLRDGPTPTPLEPVSPGISRDKTFDTFVVGGCNQFANACSQAVAEQPGDPQYNPLFIYGGTGLGKTHLLHSIGNGILLHRPQARILYVSGEQFTNELIDAIRFKTMPAFRDKYRRYPEVLLMDDVQFISGKERTQEELFHTFEWLKERGRQIVFTADVLPREIKGFEPRLRTRCESGMLADMQPPDLETLVAILHQKGEDLGMAVTPELAQFIAARVRGSIREIEGVLNRLQALCRLKGQREPTIAFARQHLGGVLPEAPRAPSADEIIKTTASQFNVKVSDLLGKRRLKTIVLPRHIAMYLVRRHTEMSFPEMGRTFHRDHATVQHGVRTIADRVKREPDLRNVVETIERQLGL